MALLDTEGFGWSTNINDYLNYGAIPFLTRGQIGTNGPLGDNYYTVNDNFSCFARALSGPRSSIFVGCRWNFFSSRYSYNGISFASPDGNTHLKLIPDYNSQAWVLTLNDGTILGRTPSNSIPASGWFYVELGAVMASGAGGSARVRINGAEVLSLTGINTVNPAASSPGVSLVRFGEVDGINGNQVCFGLAHVYVCDATGPAPWNTFLGDVRVQTLLPTANDAVQFTPNGQAANWQNAAMVPPNPGSDYNSDATVGDQDTFACAPMAAGLGTVYGVTAKVLLSKSDAGQRSMATVMKSGSAVSVGPTVVVGVSPQQARTVLAVDPATGAAWTQAGVDAAKVGYKVVA